MISTDFFIVFALRSPLFGIVIFTEIMALPLATPVANPLLFTIATAVSLEVQVYFDFLYLFFNDKVIELPEVTVYTSFLNSGVFTVTFVLIVDVLPDTL